jgi:hypothetical protein
MFSSVNPDFFLQKMRIFKFFPQKMRFRGHKPVFICIFCGYFLEIFDFGEISAKNADKVKCFRENSFFCVKNMVYLCRRNEIINGF